jgi:outer membrane protein TolC
MVGCTVGPDFQLPSFFGGKSWKQAEAREGVQLPDDWWRLYDDRELTRLVESALKANPSLEAARARVQTSRAFVGVDRARMFPVLDFNGSGTTQRFSQDAVGGQLPPGLSVPLERDRYHGSFDLAYEIDLWGKNRRSLEASQAEASAAEALHDSQRLGLAAEVVRQYFLFRGLNEQSAVLHRTIESRKATVGMEGEQLKAGLMS